jgi:uncharacterized membrane protein (UPF0136 family)
MSWLRTVLFVYGFINIAGGFMGFMMAKSVMSLVVGGLAGLLVIACAAMAASKPAMAFRAAGVISLALLGFWIFRFTEVSAAGKSTMMPMMNIVLGVVVFGCLAYGHLSKTRRRNA